jgi:hypothetical protein
MYESREKLKKEIFQSLEVECLLLVPLPQFTDQIMDMYCVV